MPLQLETLLKKGDNYKIGSDVLAPKDADYFFNTYRYATIYFTKKWS
jgi:hypothetical protein